MTDIIINKKTRILLLMISLIIILVDQITKYSVRHFLVPFESKIVIPHIWSWTLVYNSGAAFSFLANDVVFAKIFFSIIAIIVSLILIYFICTGKGNIISNIGFSSILGGAVSNLLDRLYAGKVTDFIDWYYKSYHWPTFNIADVAICIGVVLLLINNFFLSK